MIMMCAVGGLKLRADLCPADDNTTLLCVPAAELATLCTYMQMTCMLL
jgi:hypothetical protein